jgi:hypothetical protein
MRVYGRLAAGRGSRGYARIGTPPVFKRAPSEAAAIWGLVENPDRGVGHRERAGTIEETIDVGTRRTPQQEHAAANIPTLSKSLANRSVRLQADHRGWRRPYCAEATTLPPVTNRL